MHDVVVIGGGHAGLEAAAAAARVGARVALVTLEAEAIGRLSCNPAIGGIGKGHLVREVHALGGLMGRVADRCGIQFRLLNTSRGPAVRGPRAQVDRELYPRVAREELAREPVEIVEGEVTRLLVREGSDGRRRCHGVELEPGGPLEARSVVLGSGTFLGGILHVGLDHEAGGRRGEGAASRLSTELRELGLPLRRFKTGTPPRLLRSSVDWDALEPQDGDAEPTFFCPDTAAPSLPQVRCHLAHTNERVHRIVREHLDQSPLLAGRITGRGPRYCPSFEEKVIRFADRPRHVLILEPEGLESDRVYVNGASTSLPAEAQRELIRAIPGLERAAVVQLGYAVEYDHVSPNEVLPSLECRDLPGLFLAGQVLGTTGYEEAAALGLMAGANAALAAGGAAPFVLRRHEGYVGVLVDDLVTRGIDEPYRMFTSRAEHRLLLGVDSADLRLTPRAAEVGLVPAAAAGRAREREGRLELAERLLHETRVEEGRTAAETCRRPETDLARVLELIPASQRHLLGESDRERHRTAEQAAQAIRYAAYVRRQRAAVARLEQSSRRPIPPGFDFRLPGLSHEVQERLTRARPVDLEQAARLPGVTPGAVQALDAHLARQEKEQPPTVPRGTCP